MLVECLLTRTLCQLKRCGSNPTHSRVIRHQEAQKDKSSFCASVLFVARRLLHGSALIKMCNGDQEYSQKRAGTNADPEPEISCSRMAAILLDLRDISITDRCWCISLAVANDKLIFIGPRDVTFHLGSVLQGYCGARLFSNAELCDLDLRLIGSHLLSPGGHPSGRHYQEQNCK